MKRIVLLSAVLVLTTLASAQDRTPPPMQRPGGPGMHFAPGPPLRGFGGTWWKDSELATKLKLTDPQKQQLEKTFLDYRLKLIDLRADVEREETKLQPLMDADQLNEAQVSSQIDALVAARGKLEKINAMMNVSMRKVLTTDQWKQLQSLREERFRRSRGPRPSREPHGRRGGATPGVDAAPGTDDAPPAQPPKPQGPSAPDMN